MLSEMYDRRTVSAVLGSGSPTALTATVPDQMVMIIHQTKYSLFNPSDTIVAYLMTERSGTITGTIDFALLTTNIPIFPVSHETKDAIVAVVEPGNRVVGQTNTGSVLAKITYSYQYGRFRRT